MFQKLCAEALGTAFLLISIVGSGIMAAQLSEGNTGLALLAHAIAIGCMLYGLITIFGPISGAHFNPAVTLAFVLRAEIAPPLALTYVAVHILGAILGVWATHLMFDLNILQSATILHRTGVNQWSSEFISTFGLLMVIFGGLRARPEAVPSLVALYITGAVYFTASSSFANPAVSLARALTDTFTGIYPAHVLGFVVAQVLAVFLGHAVLTRLFR